MPTRGVMSAPAAAGARRRRAVGAPLHVGNMKRGRNRLLLTACHRGGVQRAKNVMAVNRGIGERKEIA